MDTNSRGFCELHEQDCRRVLRGTARAKGVGASDDQLVSSRAIKPVRPTDNKMKSKSQKLWMVACATLPLLPTTFLHGSHAPDVSAELAGAIEEEAGLPATTTSEDGTTPALGEPMNRTTGVVLAAGEGKLAVLQLNETSGEFEVVTYNLDELTDLPSETPLAAGDEVVVESAAKSGEQPIAARVMALQADDDAQAVAEMPLPVDPELAEGSSDRELFSFGKVVALTPNSVTLRQYDFAMDADVEAPYQLQPDTEYGNVSAERPLQIGDDVVLDFLNKDGQQFVTTLVREEPLRSMEWDAPEMGSESTNPPVRVLRDEQSYQDYTVHVYEPGEYGEGFFEILRGEELVYSNSGGRFEISGSLCDERTNALVQMGRNINGEGTPNLVVVEWTGGAHCCAIFHIFEIGERFRLIEEINAADSECARFEDLRHDGNLDLVLNDHTFAYWNACFALSPAPHVLLRYHEGKYHLDAELMRKSAPTDGELSEQVEAIKAQFADNEGFMEGNAEWKAPPALWGEMLDWIYSGNMDMAWRLCDLAWPSDCPGKDKFLEDFRQQLKESPYY